VQILLEAVDHHLQNHTDEQGVREKYSTEAQRKAAKVPWKQVAEYMEKRGCYRYGNATVKKKYLKVMEDPLSF
jgi:formiminotetrahydrofolate cyclodeaminase